MNIRVTVAGQELTRALELPSDWRVTALRYGAASDSYTLRIEGPDVQGVHHMVSEMVLTREPGALIYRDERGVFLGACETSRSHLPVDAAEEEW